VPVDDRLDPFARGDLARASAELTVVSAGRWMRRRTSAPRRPPKSSC
jgi:hypothetical protein